uniref:Ig-like domain-containing protein n=1 Tax=Xiphophorus maculatus TaxID=8083 RepID=A0A3B5R8G4_XIPMA
MFSGESITLTCEVQGGETTEWTCEWRRSGSIIHKTDSKDWTFNVSESSSGNYMCQCRSRDDWYSSTQWSETIRLSVSISNKVFVTRQPNWPLVFSGESITLTCEVQGGETTEWTCEWRRSGSIIQWTDSKDWTFNVSESSSGNYMCQCRSRDDWYSSTQWSETITGDFISYKPRAKLAAGSSTIPVGGSVTLSCSVKPSAGWKYRWFRRTSDTSFVEFSRNNEENREITVTQRGIYKCDGKRGNPSFYISNKVFVTRRPIWPQMFSGESITLTCEVQGGETTEWTCEWKKSGSIIHKTDSKDWTFNVSESSSGNYMCQCRSRDDWYSSTQWITLLLSLSAVVRILPNRSQFFPYESVTLSCVDSENSPDWTVKRNTAGNETADWGKRNGSQHVIDAVYPFDSGRYWCEFRTGACSEVINVTVTDGPVILQSPVLPVAEGDAVILRCIHSDASSSSNFTKFYKNGLLIGSSSTGSIAVRDVSESDEGLYKCSITGAGESPESWLSVRVCGWRSFTYSKLCEMFLISVCFKIRTKQEMF